MQSERVKTSVGCDIKRGSAKENMHGADGSVLSGVLGPAEKELFHRGKKAGMSEGWKGTNRKGRLRESRRTWDEQTRASLVGKRRAGGEGERVHESGRRERKLAAAEEGRMEAW